ncbi:MAG: hypothetical protein HYZ53_15560 [Planctomycetes bacterium]|nr:hypothetical protein [Planctomycetota bacterium]
MRKLPFPVALAIPSLGGRAQIKLKSKDQEEAVRVVLESSSARFGGATPLTAAPGGLVGLEDGTVLFDAEGSSGPLTKSRHEAWGRGPPARANGHLSFDPP